MIEEMLEKERRIREMMAREKLDAVAITGTGNFAWLTCGGSNFVGTSTEVGASTAVITADKKYLICDNIEAPRISNEELAGQGYEFRAFPWYENGKGDIIKDIVKGGCLGSDIPMTGARDIASALDPCRYSLTHQEIERYKWLGRNVGECLSATAREIEPGMTEHEIAGVLDKHIYERGIIANLTLVAVDDRISKYRHPLPTDKKLEKCAMLVTGARKWGLVLSATRMVHFGDIPSELRRKHDAVMKVDAALIANTRAGVKMGDIFSRAIDAYAKNGFPDEWRLHHQGGPTGYKGRDFRVNQETDAVAAENQAFAWNPSITGTKTEDTIIAITNGPVILSETDDWPKTDVKIDGMVIHRPDILVR